MSVSKLPISLFVIIIDFLTIKKIYMKTINININI